MKIRKNFLDNKYPIALLYIQLSKGNHPMNRRLERAYKNLKKICKAYARQEGIRFQASPVAPDTYEGMKEYFLKHGHFLVYNGGDHGFLGKKGNLLFRAVHDYTHLVYALGFNFQDETQLAEVTKEIFGEIGEGLGLSSEAIQDVKKLLHIEMKDQIDYYYEKGEFVKDQKQFILENW
jgi:hypothetical protein